MALDAQKAIYSKIYVFEIERGDRIDDESWTQDITYTNCWWIDYSAPGEPDRVEENGADYTERATIILCNANAGSWFFDPATDRLYIHTTGSDEPLTESYIILAYEWEYYVSDQFEHEEIICNGKFAEPLLIGDAIPDVLTAVSDFSKGGIQQSASSIKLDNSEGYFDERVADYIYEAKRFIMRFGERRSTYPSDFLIILNGWSGDNVGDDKILEIDIADLRGKYA